MAAIVATIIFSTAIGVWAEGRYGGRAGTAARRALLFVLYVVLPPVTFLNLVHAEIDFDAGAGLVLAFVAVVATAGIAWVICSRTLGLSRPATGSVMNAALVANTGYLGYPVVVVAFGLDSLSDAIVYDILVTVPLLILGGFGIGAAFGASAGDGPTERTGAFLARNPLLYAAALALIAPEALVPDWAVDASRIAVLAIMPLGFFAVGAALAEEADEGQLAVPPPVDAPLAVAVALRLVVAPGLLFLLALPLIDLPDIYLVLAAMPVGINSLVVAHAYGLDLRLSAGAIAWTTGIAAVGILVGSIVL